MLRAEYGLNLVCSLLCCDASIEPVRREQFDGINSVRPDCVERRLGGLSVAHVIGIGKRVHSTEHWACLGLGLVPSKVPSILL